MVMKKEFSRIDVILTVSFLASLCLIVFLCGFYLGFSATRELERELTGISFGGGNLYRERAGTFGMVGILTLISSLSYYFVRWQGQIIGFAVLSLSLFLTWELFISTPATLSDGSAGINFILYLDLLVLPLIVITELMALTANWRRWNGR